MKSLAFFLALCCGAALAQSQSPAFVPTLPEAPPGLTAQQTQAWNLHRTLPSIKSIKIISFDPALLNGNQIVINQDGKSIVIKGQSVPNTLEVPAPGGPPVDPKLIWRGQSDDGRSDATVIYNLQTGFVTGSFIVDGRSFALRGPANAPLWVETRGDINEPPHMTTYPPRPESALPPPGVQK